MSVDLRDPSVGIDAATGSIVTGWEHVVQSLRDIFDTRFGSRIMREWYGSFVPNLLGRLITPNEVTPYFAAITSAIEQWEPRFNEYDRTNGGLAFKVVAVHGGLIGAEHADWVISASAGLAQTILEVAGEVGATLTAAQEAAGVAEGAAATALEIIANGPVSSVNGKTGLVALGMADIPNLVAAIGAKADTNHGHSIAQVSNLQTTLTGLQSQITNFDGGAY